MLAKNSQRGKKTAVKLLIASENVPTAVSPTEVAVSAESESENEEDEEDKAVRLAYEEMIRKQHAKAEAKRVEKEKKSMKAKITEYRADFIGKINLTEAEIDGEIAMMMAKIAILNEKKTACREKISAVNRGEYDEEILARKVEENAPKKIVKKIGKKAGTGEGGEKEKTTHYGKLSWGKMLGSDTLIRYGLHTDRSNCVYGLAAWGEMRFDDCEGGRTQKVAGITPTDCKGETLLWARSDDGAVVRTFGTLSGFVRSVLIYNGATASNRSSWDIISKNTPFGEYYDKRDNAWKPMSGIKKGDVINA